MNGMKIKLQIFDTAEQRILVLLYHSYYRSAIGNKYEGQIVYNISNKNGWKKKERMEMKIYQQYYVEVKN
ncbi:unnamed protein product [Paramecium sonneborni]|uniref:Uncharacterized protein n=1 Tax=Paramecium sonneborni TaxID=65129 RepID=A0A8S1KH08_9CILI|nr:unnamed protein product [Paramecium sonneborni]